jgi:hypothetical protein
MAGKFKTLFEAAEKLEKGASRRVGALGNKGVRIEPGSRVGSAVGGIKDPKTGKVLKKDKIKDLTSKGRRRIAGTGAAGAGAAALSGGSDDKPKKKDFTKGVSRGGVPFKEAFRKARKDGKKTFEWNDKEYTTDLASEKKKESKPKATTAKKKQGAIFGKDAKFRPFGGVLARALLGDDEKFGGERGLIDFVRTKKKPVKKNKGGMAKKGYARGGAVGMSMKSKMASKGGKMGGKVPPGYKNGGSVGRKKARGVGAAKRGFGKAMR